MLNNHGWGFRAYIILSAILLIALLIACFLITRLYSSIPSLKDGVDGPRTYETVEESIKDATSLYEFGWEIKYIIPSLFFVKLYIPIEINPEIYSLEDVIEVIESEKQIIP